MRKTIPAVLLGLMGIFIVLVFGFSKIASSSETIPLLIIGSTLIGFSIFGGKII
jgi:hypothetical protein